MRHRFTTEIARITYRWYLHHRVLLYTVTLVSTWVFIFLLYAVSVRAVAMFAQHNVESEFVDPEDNFAVFYGLGIVLASILTPLFGLLYLTSEMEAIAKDENLRREFLEVGTALGKTDKPKLGR